VSASEGKTQEAKTLIEDHNTQKWASTKRGIMSKLPGHMPSKEWMINKFLKRKW
jgi:hypothetical protein